jgi:hypothetical protein
MYQVEDSNWCSALTLPIARYELVTGASCFPRPCQPTYYSTTKPTKPSLTSDPRRRHYWFYWRRHDNLANHRPARHEQAWRPSAPIKVLSLQLEGSYSQPLEVNRPRCLLPVSRARWPSSTLLAAFGFAPKPSPLK